MKELQYVLQKWILDFKVDFFLRVSIFEALYLEKMGPILSSRTPSQN